MPTGCREYREMHDKICMSDHVHFIDRYWLDDVLYF